jgi:phosphoribosylanthranilate isomerase
MTKIKLCGLSGIEEIEAANELKPEYIGFVFAPKSRRYVTPEKAAELKKQLSGEIQAAGVFVNEAVEKIAELLNDHIIDIAQLHGDEDEDYIKRLRQLTGKPIIKAFQVKSEKEIADAEQCSADYILLDSGAGTGTVFDWNILKKIDRPYFLAGGLSAGNVGKAVRELHPFAVDVSSGIETDRRKDKEKMAAFVAAVRKEETL